MSTHVVGFIPPDEKWKEMKAAYDACAKAGVSIPEEVSAFFGHAEPDESGREVSLEEDCAKPWQDDYRQGFEVDISKLPPHVKTVRFYNSW